MNAATTKREKEGQNEKERWKQKIISLIEMAGTQQLKIIYLFIKEIVG